MSKIIDLQFNYPTINEAQLVEDFFKNLNQDELYRLLALPPYKGMPEHLQAAAEWLGLSEQVYPAKVDVILCNSGNHALACVFDVLKEEHQHVITEPFTYGTFKSIARQAGFALEVAEWGDDGYTVASLREVIERTGSRLVYIQPTIHNPTCVVMSLERRQQLAELAREKDLLFIEDDAYRFLHPEPPPSFLDIIPERTIHIESLSKPFNPLIKTTYIVAPAALSEAIVNAVRLTSSGNSTLLAHLATHLIKSGGLEATVAKKRELAIELQAVVKDVLGHLSYQTFPTSFHLWLRLPEHIKSTELVKRAKEEQVNIPDGVSVSVGKADGERYVRLALGSEQDPVRVEKGLRKVAELLR